MLKSKAFTLVEILMVIVILSLLASFTIPSILKITNEAQYKVKYKKAHAAIYNLLKMKKISDGLPSSPNAQAVEEVLYTLQKHLSVSDFAKPEDGDNFLNTGKLYFSDDYKTELKIPNTGLTKTDNFIEYNRGDEISPWINTQDDISYLIMKGEGTTCKTTKGIEANKTRPQDDACAIIVVDTNGLSKGPNKLQEQIIDIDKVNTEISDRFYIYVGTDGATAGNKITTLTGRIVANLR